MIKWMLSLLLTLTSVSVQADELSSQLDGYLRASDQHLQELELSTWQGRLVRAIYALPDDQYETAVLTLGDRWKSRPNEIEPVLSKLQLKWDFDNPARAKANENKSAAQLLEQAQWFSIATFLLSTFKPTALPLAITLFAILHTGPSAASMEPIVRRAPFAILNHMAAPKIVLQETASREFNNAVIDIGEGFLASSLMLGSRASSKLGWSSFSGARFAKQLLVISAVSFAVGGALKFGAEKIHEDELVTELKKLEQDLDQAVAANSENLNTVAKNYRLAAERLAAYYNFDRLAELSKLDNSGQLPTGYLANSLLDSINSLCERKVDERYLVRALIEGRSTDALSIFQIGTRGLQAQYRHWATAIHFRTTGKAYVSDKEQYQFEASLLSASPQNRPIFEEVESALKKNQRSCGDSVYLFFTVAEHFDSLARRFPRTFVENADLEEARNAIQSDLTKGYQARVAIMAAAKASPHGRN
jgi:hypothetical protein